MVGTFYSHTTGKAIGRPGRINTFWFGAARERARGKATPGRLEVNTVKRLTA